jgi:hypothetical protein
LWLTALCWALAAFQFLDLIHRRQDSSNGDEPVTRPLLNTGHKHRINAYIHQTSMPWVGFQPTITASERTKTVHALDRAATMTGFKILDKYKIAKIWSVHYIGTFYIMNYERATNIWALQITSIIYSSPNFFADFFCKPVGVVFRHF